MPVAANPIDGRPHECLRLFAWEHGALWPLIVKGCEGEGGTLGYADGTRGVVPAATEIEVRYAETGEYRHADRFASELEKAGYERVLVLKGWPRDGEVGHHG